MLSEVRPAPLSPIGIHPAEKPDVSDSEKLEIVVKALRFYAENSVYKYPDLWNSLKMGGHPQIEHYDEVSYVAEAALKEIGL